MQQPPLKAFLPEPQGWKHLSAPAPGLVRASPAAARCWPPPEATGRGGILRLRVVIDGIFPLCIAIRTGFDFTGAGTLLTSPSFLSFFIVCIYLFFFFFMLHPLRSFQLSFKQILESPFLKTNSATSCCARSQPNHWLSLRGLLRHLPALSPPSPGKTSSWWHQMPSPCARLRELISKIPPHFGATTINASTREGETHRKRSSGFFPF